MIALYTITIAGTTASFASNYDPDPTPWWRESPQDRDERLFQQWCQNRDAWVRLMRVGCDFPEPVRLTNRFVNRRERRRDERHRRERRSRHEPEDVRRDNR